VCISPFFSTFTSTFFLLCAEQWEGSKLDVSQHLCVSFLKTMTTLPFARPNNGQQPRSLNPRRILLRFIWEESACAMPCFFLVTCTTSPST
jgi:hypothetical protein